MDIRIVLVALISIASCTEPKQKITHVPIKKIDREIAFVSNRSGNSEIYIMDINGGSLQNITNNESLDFSPSWSADGANIYFYSKRVGNAEIYRTKSSGDELKRITNHPAADVLPVPSPNGKWILFVSERDSISRNLYIADIDGSNVKPLTLNEDYEESPDWSPDGQKIIFTRQIRESTDTSHAANGEIHIMNADGRNVQRLTNKEGYDSGAKFSPDGEKIAFYGHHDNFWDLYLMDIDGGNLLNLTNDTIECYSPDWSPDGESLVYTAGADGTYNIWLINIKTRERIQLTNTNGRNEGPSWKKSSRQ